jgi:hypothetical protein
MSYEVDVVGVGPFTIASDEIFGKQPSWSGVAFWPGEIAMGQWFAAALQVDDHRPGASVTLVSQAPVTRADGSQGLRLTVANTSTIPGAIQFTVNLISTPSHG